MEPIGNILRLPKEKTPAMEEEARKIYLEKLLLLPSTEELEKAVEADRHDADPRFLERSEKQLALGRERDEIAKTRPEGCKCLGLGILPFPVKQMGGRLVFNAAGYKVVHYCLCSEGQGKQEIAKEQRRIEHAQRLKERIQKVWYYDDTKSTDANDRIRGSASIPERFVEFRFETAPSSPAKDAMVRYFAERDEEDFAASWFLHGGYGGGKTGLAISYAWQALQEEIYWTVFFRSVPNLLTELRASYNRDADGPTETELLEKYQAVDLLILDDLGAEQITGSGWVADRLYQIIGGRHAEKQATLFTSNLFLDALADRIGERITWRILEMCGEDHILEVKGPNLRDFRKGG